MYPTIYFYKTMRITLVWNETKCSLISTYRVSMGSSLGNFRGTGSTETAGFLRNVVMGINVAEKLFVSIYIAEYFNTLAHIFYFVYNQTISPVIKQYLKIKTYVLGKFLGNIKYVYKRIVCFPSHGGKICIQTLVPVNETTRCLSIGLICNIWHPLSCIRPSYNSMFVITVFVTLFFGASLCIYSFSS